jgi:parvulin-like peptidyl-prolyl isomerase
MFAPLFLAVFALAAPQAPAQKLPEGIVATWDGGQFKMADFERFLGRTFKNKQLGNDALRHILQIKLVELEADRRSLAVPPELLKQRLNEAHDAAEKSGVDLKQVVESRGLTMADFRKLLGDSVLHEMMARQDLKLGRGVEVSAEQLQQWTDQRLEDLLRRAASAPEGYAIDASPYVVTLVEVGRTMREILGPIRLGDYLNQLVLETYLPLWAQQEGLVLTDDILQAEIDWRRRRVEEHPAYGGISYETALQTQGATLESVRTGSELRLAGYLRLYCNRLFDDAWFNALDPEVRQELIDEYGDKRHVSWLLLRANQVKKTEIDLNFDDAAKELDNYAARMKTAKDFAKAAEVYSEDEDTRRRAGMLGWITKTGAGVDPLLAAEVFKAPVGHPIGPVRVMDGMALFWVHDVRPIASEADFRAEVRRGRHNEIRKRILEQIHLNTVYDPLIQQAMPKVMPAGG